MGFRGMGLRILEGSIRTNKDMQEVRRRGGSLKGV